MNKLILGIAIALVSTVAFSEKNYTVEQLESLIAANNKPSILIPSLDGSIAKDDFPTCKSGLIEWLDGVKTYPVTIEKDIDGEFSATIWSESKAFLVSCVKSGDKAKAIRMSAEYSDN
ncbi:hypothetical protein NQ837_001058 [Providencia rettgeri]|uniref:hypothetical protein n=1 Tax=Providencia TaxID=586 RepID=UPI00065E03AE|nr:hypothetical protein [Providencia rettgeri]EJD6541051.1 hypothetical protein [Providencia rettgeri]ELQ1456590.1 hypothetical protein [Providencia rettgeri]ELR5176423.1 hypothetical protein [Providencia rettgeri]ELR5185773.1 hypothetical protein [Providencia rettgeri]ELR5260271.1 hypothetical protein [Providencia rettgeri]